MTKRQFTQQQAEKMYELLIEIHAGLKDKNTNKKPMSMPSIEIFWMIAIEEYFPEEKRIMKNLLKKSKMFSN